MKCEMCSYISGEITPQEVCPVCKIPPEKFVELDKDGKEVVGSLAAESGRPALSGEEISKSMLVRHHLHPIFSHFLNGILPIVVALLVLSIGFNSVSLESAVFYNLIAVLLTLPLVLFTGFLEWRRAVKVL